MEPIGPLKELGEYVIIVGKAHIEPQRHLDSWSVGRAIDMFGCMTASGTFEDSDAVALTAKAFDLDEQVVRKAVKKHKIAENQRRPSLP